MLPLAGPTSRQASGLCTLLYGKRMSLRPTKDPGNDSDPRSGSASAKE
jgi:hypothetical protein